MAEKCVLCGEKIEETFLGKVRGTLVKVKDEKKNKNQFYCACSECQQKYPHIKEEIKKRAM